MWVLIFDLTFGEADTSDKFIRDIDHSPDLDIYSFTFLVEFSHWFLKLVPVAANEQSCHVVAVGELPWVVLLLLSHHILESCDHVFGLTGLGESRLEDLGHLALILRITLTINA